MAKYTYKLVPKTPHLLDNLRRISDTLEKGSLSSVVHGTGLGASTIHNWFARDDCKIKAASIKIVANKYGFSYAELMHRPLSAEEILDRATKPDGEPMKSPQIELFPAGQAIPAAKVTQPKADATQIDVLDVMDWVDNCDTKSLSRICKYLVSELDNRRGGRASV
jgi:hypothetical protein